MIVLRGDYMKKIIGFLLLLYAVSFMCPRFANAKQIKLNNVNVNLKKGDTYVLVLKNVKKKNVKWKSSNEKIVKVKKGKLKAFSVGKANIIAKYKKSRYVCKVEVYADSNEHEESNNNVSEANGVNNTFTGKVNSVSATGSSVVINVEFCNNTTQEIRLGRDFYVEKLENGG